MTEPADDRVRILLVDDSADKLLSLGAILDELGQEVVEARSGREALRKLLTQEFAVVLLDVNMPGMDGFETAAMIRQRKSSEHTPIIFITSYGDQTHAARGYSLGAVDYIPSPVVPEVLRSKVRVFVELHILQKRIGRQAEERIALAASEAALKVAEESTRRSTMLAGLSHALSGPLDVGEGMQTLLAHVVPALAAHATVAMLDEQDQVERVARRTCVAEEEPTGSEIAPSELPAAHAAMLREAIAQAHPLRPRETPFADGALHPLALRLLIGVARPHPGGADDDEDDE